MPGRKKVDRLVVNCLWCGKPSQLRIKEVRIHGRGKYCSASCHGKAWSTGENNRNWSGGRIVAATGYVYIKSPTHPRADSRNYVAEHRLVMEKHVCRYLLPQEEVHHLNKDKQDNRIENLELFANHAEHIKRYHRNNGIKTQFKKKEKVLA